LSFRFVLSNPVGYILGAHKAHIGWELQQEGVT